MFAAFVEDEYALGTHVEQKVRDAQVRDEAVLLLEHLIICCRMKLMVVLPSGLGGYCMTKIGHSIGVLSVFDSRLQRHVQSDEAARQPSQLHIEIVEELELLLVEGTEVVLVILEEGGVAVGRLEGIPVLMAPVAVVADADVAHQALALSALLGGDGERQRAVGIGYEAPVAIGLLGVVVAPFDIDSARTASQELGVELYRSQIGR